MVAPRSRAARAITVETAPQPPSGWKTPYSYSRNDRIEKRLGQLKGDIPRYFDWNVIASRIRGSSKYRLSSPSSDSQGRSRGRIFRSWGDSRSRHPKKGDSRTLRNSFILTRLSAMNL